MFDPSRREPALLTPGTRVRFEARRGRVSASSVGRLAATIRPRTGGSVRVPRQPDQPVSHAAFTILAPGPLALVQDGGRPGHAAIGVSRSGAFDRSALVRANRAVGNEPFTPALELLVGPMRLRAEAPTVVAVAGAPAPVTVTRRDTETGHLELSPEVERGRAIALDPGDLVEIGPVTHGLRMMLAVRGGVVVPRQLGSASRDTLSALGPEPLATGDTVHVGPEHGLDAVPWCDAGVAGGLAVDEHPAPAEVPIVLGPRHVELGEAAVTALLGQEWTVRADSDRIGVRLDGTPLPVPDGAGSLPSEPMVPGAIQVPPSGLPVVFGPDGPATGGYPVIGVLTPEGLDLLAQAAPGSTLRFRDAA
nr:biotin-dependent carboxyltransferase family protein [Brachybacterium muris]